MKVRDLLNMEIDVDVYDNVCEELAIAFCGPVTLTDEGREQFKDALDLDVKAINAYGITIDVDDEDESIFEKKLKSAKAFFWSAAGFCADSDFKKWFADNG